MNLNEIMSIIMGLMFFALMAYAAYRIGHTDFSKDLK